MIPETIRKFRKDYRAQHISKYYSGILHFCFTSLASLGIIAYAILRLKDVGGLEWLAVPITFFFANVVEYRGHKGPMHHPTRKAAILYRRHTLEHHRFFTHDAMIYESTRDFKMVLFPPIMLFFFVGLHAVPVGLALYYLVSANVAYLFVATAIGYFLTYEWLHFCYHLHEDSWVGRLPFMGRLRRLHTNHHNPALMTHYNFNITFPISDALFGTYYAERPAETAEAHR